MIAGGCRCGAVRYTIDLTAMAGTYACHCTICQRVTGSSFAHQMPVREEALAVSGELALVSIPTRGGGLSVQRFCAACLSRVYNTNSAWPGVAIVRSGTVDGSETLSPSFHIYTSTKQPWIVLPEGAEAYEDAAPTDAYQALLAG